MRQAVDRGKTRNLPCLSETAVGGRIRLPRPNAARFERRIEGRGKRSFDVGIVDGSVFRPGTRGSNRRSRMLRSALSKSANRFGRPLGPNRSRRSSDQFSRSGGLLGFGRRSRHVRPSSRLVARLGSATEKMAAEERSGRLASAVASASAGVASCVSRSIAEPVGPGGGPATRRHPFHALRRRSARDPSFADGEPGVRCESSRSACFRPLSADAAMNGSVTLPRAKIDVRATAFDMLTMQYRTTPSTTYVGSPWVWRARSRRIRPRRSPRRR